MPFCRTEYQRQIALAQGISIGHVAGWQHGPGQPQQQAHADQKAHEAMGVARSVASDGHAQIL